VNTLTVPLTQGKTAIIDACDGWVLDLKWRSARYSHAWYAVRTEGPNRKAILLHRLILSRVTGGNRPEMKVDHINGNTLDDRRVNLRWATNAESMSNRLAWNNSSGVNGVSWDKAISKWRAQIQHHGRKVHLGFFASLEAAADVRFEAAAQYHGEFASELSRGF
jgi:HNH endonuclease/AP2 domain